MKSPWESDYRNRGDEFDHHRLSERSTSAPPPETSLLFGRNEKISGGNSYLGSGLSDGHKLNNLYENGHHGDVAGSLFLNSGNDRGKAGLSNSFEAGPPGFSSDLFSSGADGLSSSSTTRNYNGRNTNSYLGSLDRKTIGDNIVRSHSAAPSLDGRLSLGPPPGLGGGSRETPLTSNRSSDSYLESTLDSSHIVQLQQQRPASTGVIGGSQNSSSAVLDSLGLGGRSNGAVRPVAKGLMDLIQEDFPPESPIDLYGNNYPTTGSREDAYLERGPLERPRTTSPLSQPISRDTSYLYRNREEPVIRHENGNHTAESVNRFPFGTRSDRAQPQASPQYTTVSDHGEANRPKGSIYAPIPQQSRPQPLRPQQQRQNFDMPQQGYNAPAPVHTHVQTQPMHTHVQNQPVQHQPHVQNHPVPTHIQNQPLQSPHVQTHSGFNAPPPVQAQHLQAQVLPNGQTIYVNAPPPQYHGYTTVQYHPHGQQHHIVHQQIPGTMGGPPGSEQQQYISVVPIQNPGGAVQSIGPGGTYAYWQPDGQHGIPQTLTIVNPHGPGGVPVAVARVGNTPAAESPRRPQSNNSQGSGGGSGGRGGKEKSNGKGRRSCGGQTQSSSSRRSGGGGGGGGGGGESSKTPNPSGSPLLEEFKAKKSRDWKMYEIKGHVVEFCQDQNGSRFIQQRLEVGDDGEKEVVMNEVLPAIRRLRNDVFGNYVVQKLLDFGTPKMKSDIRDTLQGEMLPLSLQMYGCRVVQKAMETLDETDLPPLLKEFHSNVLSCIHDQNGNHVIQKCIEVMSEKSREARDNGENSTADFFNEQIDFIVDDVLDNVTSLSCHPYGCRVLQRILEHCVEPKKSRALDEISKCHRTLLDDQYGNYVIQHVLQFGRLEDRDSVLEIVAENGLLLMSRQKFASNVVEKLLKYGNAQQRKAVVREMLKIVDEKTGEVLPEGEEEDGASVVLLMVRDAYANYVVQTTLDVISECEEKRALLEELNAHSTELKTYTFAKHIVTKLGA